MRSIFTFLSSFKKLAAVLGLVSLFIAILVRFFLKELTESFIGLLILGLILLLIFAIGARVEIAAFLRSKRGRYGVNTIVMVIIFILIMICANYLGIIKHRRFDVTASGKFTLAPQTVNVIKGLKTPVDVVGFFPPGVPELELAKSMAMNLLEEYRYFNNKISYQFVDPESKPAMAKQYKVRYHGTIVFKAGDRQKAVMAPTEQSFTNALLEVSGTQSKKIYFLTGNGERDISNKNYEGYGTAQIGLVKDLYKVDTLNLTMTSKIPEDCAVLIMAGTKTALPPKGKETLRAFLKNNGKLMVLTDPNPPAEINEILTEWGIRVNAGRVIDKGAYAAPDMGTPAVFRDQYPPVIITSGIDTTYFPDATTVDITSDLKRVLASVSKKNKSEAQWPKAPAQYKSLVVLPVLLTTSSSWLEAEKSDAGDSGKTKGPFVLGAMLIAGEPLITQPSSTSAKSEKLTRIVVIGDTDFASNVHIQNGGNNDLFLNAVNWLAEEEHLISIRPKQYSFRRLLVSKNVVRFIRYSSVGLLPIVILIIGGIVWWRKR